MGSKPRLRFGPSALHRRRYVWANVWPLALGLSIAIVIGVLAGVLTNWMNGDYR